MAFVRYELFIKGEKAGDHPSLKAVWSLLDDAYSRLPDPYGDYLRWEIQDMHEERVCRFNMAGGIWEACCEDAKAFAMYLNIAGWEPFCPR